MTSKTTDVKHHEPERPWSVIARSFAPGLQLCSRFFVGAYFFTVQFTIWSTLIVLLVQTPFSFFSPYPVWPLLTLIERPKNFQLSLQDLQPQHKLLSKIEHLGLKTCPCNWVLDNLSERLQSVVISSNTSSILKWSTRAPQGCVLGPLLFILLNHHCERTKPHNEVSWWHNCGGPHHHQQCVSSPS